MELCAWVAAAGAPYAGAIYHVAREPDTCSDLQTEENLWP